jgi:hypothetical protein
MTNDHVVHVLDRFMATFMAVAYIWKMSALYFYGRPTTFFAQLVSFTFALFAFMNSQDAQETRDVNGFVFWHCLCHIFPFQIICIETYDVYVLGEYNVDVEPVSGDKKEPSKLTDYVKNLVSSLVLVIHTPDSDISILSENCIDSKKIS